MGLTLTRGVVLWSLVTQSSVSVNHNNDQDTLDIDGDEDSDDSEDSADSSD